MGPGELDAVAAALAESLDGFATLEGLADEIIWRLRAGGISDCTIRNVLLNPPRRVIEMRQD